MRAIIYIRVSSGQQQYNGSFVRQMQYCQDACRELGLSVYAVYGDVFPGDTTNRPALDAALAMAAEVAPCVLMIESLDRLSRLSAERTLALLGDLAAARVQVVAAMFDEPPIWATAWFVEYAREQLRRAYQDILYDKSLGNRELERRVGMLPARLLRCANATAYAPEAGGTPPAGGN